MVVIRIRNVSPFNEYETIEFLYAGVGFECKELSVSWTSYWVEEGDGDNFVGIDTDMPTIVLFIGQSGLMNVLL